MQRGSTYEATRNPCLADTTSLGPADLLMGLREGRDSPSRPGSGAIGAIAMPASSTYLRFQSEDLRFHVT
jgi:hypothetical protein